MRINIEAAWNAVRLKMSKSKSATGTAHAPDLLPLTPRYVRAQHEDYFLAIEAALAKSSSTTNIALTGNYGVGKSSILSEVARHHRRKVVLISLSSLGFPDDAPHEKVETTSKTNRIQKEIVKQILYSQDPVKMAGSRYRRMTKFRLVREVGLAALIGVPLTIAFFLVGWTHTLIDAIPPAGNHRLSANVAVFVAVSLLIVGFRAAFHNRIQIEKITAGSATISLSAKSATFFDEYLDEIVYFFETRKPDIVIFEDIDRFDNAHIFETLRSLNTLLNSARQLKGRKIRFIYAIKDSIFDELGNRAADEKDTVDEDEPAPASRADKKPEDAAAAEVARANRTKFFDLVIPVVPFITHRSARDLLVQTLGNVDQDISDDLIDLTARHVADMRLIINIRNEFVIFKKRIIDNADLTLSQNGLFAMMLYKSTHLTDFERIRLGKSDLDHLYEDTQQLVSRNLRQIDVRLRETRQEQRTARAIAGQAQQFGESLNEYLSTTERQLGRDTASYSFNGEGFTTEAFSTDAFWDKVSLTDAPLVVSYFQPTYSYQPISLNISRSDMARIVGDSLHSEDWRASERARLATELERLKTERSFLTSADMSDLIGRPEFTLEENVSSSSLRGIAERRLKSELAVQLVTTGYIDRNFTLYTSTFYSNRVSENAMNFIIKHVEPNLMSIDFVLSESDVATVIRESRQEFINERSSYNVSVLNHLLESDIESATVLVKRLTQYESDEQDLLLAYMQAGTRKRELVQILTPLWSRIFLFLIEDAGLDDDSLLTLMTTALESLDDQLDYDKSSSLGTTLRDAYEKLPVLTSTSTSAAVATSVAKFFASVGFFVPSLNLLSEANRRAIVAAGAYAVTRENLIIALRHSNLRLSLDVIATEDEAVYRRVLQDLSAFLDVLTDGEVSIETAESFVPTLDDVAEADKSQLTAVVARSSAVCAVDLLSATPTGAWQALAEHRRFPATFINVRDYIAEFGLDEQLAHLLESTEIDASGEADDDQKLELAKTILKATEVLPDPSTRAELIVNLDLDDPLDPEIVPQEKGRLIGCLLASGLLEDGAAAFARLSPDDYAGFEYAAAHSVELQGFLSSAILSTQYVERLMVSTEVPDAIKVAVIDHYDDVVAPAPRAALNAVMQYAYEQSVTLPMSVVIDMAQRDGDRDLVLRVLRPNLPDATLADLSPILEAFGDDFEKLREANGKRATLPNTETVQAIAARLEELGVVNSANSENGQLKVNMKRQ